MFTFIKERNGNSATKTVFVLGLVFILVLGGYLLLRSRKNVETDNNVGSILDNKNGELESLDDQILSIKSSIMRYQLEDNITDYGYINYNFNDDSTELIYAQGSIDLNGDGKYSENEIIILNKKVKVIKGFPNRFSFTLPEELKDVDKNSVFNVKLSLTNNKVSNESANNIVIEHEIAVIVETEVLDTEFGLDIPGSSEHIKRGVGLNIDEPMDFEETGIESSDLPDLSGGPMDCFPIATANNLINMTSQNDRRDDLPENPQDIINELKVLMNYSDGVTNSNFLIGKNAFVEKYDLPITTEVIKQPTINDLAFAFANADAIEISTIMIRSASNKKNTGHVFTGVSAYQDGEEAGLAVHDPATSLGTDTMNIKMTDGDNQYILVEYPMWDGIVLIDAIYLQYWDYSNTEECEVEEVSDSSLVEMELSYDHVKPGEYSEVSANVSGLVPGEIVTAYLTGGGLSNIKVDLTADDDGVAQAKWRITQYDEYEIILELDEETEIKESIEVK